MAPLNGCARCGLSPKRVSRGSNSSAIVRIHEGIAKGTVSLRTREKIDPAPTALPWGGCKMIGRPAGARCRASGEARRQSKFGDFSIFYFFTDSHGRGSVTLAKHETFFPNRERKRPVHLNFSRILTVAVR